MEFPKLFTAAKNAIFVMSMSVVLASCATREYKIEEAACIQEWMEIIPPEYQQELVNSVRHETIPTTNCSTWPGGGTRCYSGSKTIKIPYVEAVTVDIHRHKRNALIEVCTAKACKKKFGNKDCKRRK